MRTTMLFCLILLVVNTSCDQGSSGSDARTFDNLLVVRNGGGDKSFTVQPLQGYRNVSIVVTRYQFRDTLVTFQCVSDQSNENTFVSLDGALHGRINISGDYHPPVTPTGTWVNLYMVRESNKQEITNSDLRNQLLGFESIVQNHFQAVK